MTTDMLVPMLLVALVAVSGAGCIGSCFVWLKLRRMDQSVRYLPSHIWNTAAVLQACDFRSPPPPSEEWAASSDLLAELFRCVLELKPRTVVELGSGLSTLVIASAMHRNGAGRLISIEDQPVHAAATRANLLANGLGHLAEVRVVRVLDQVLHGQRRPWYDVDALMDLREIDIVFVDGPGVAGSDDVRFPSMPVFWDRLRVGGLLVMDDAAREGERAMARRWQAQFDDADFEFKALRKGALFVRKLPVNQSGNA